MPGVLDNSGILDALEKEEAKRLSKNPQEALHFLVTSVASLNKEAAGAREKCEKVCQPGFNNRITTVEEAVEEVQTLVDRVKTVVWAVVKVCAFLAALVGVAAAVYGMVA